MAQYLLGRCGVGFGTRMGAVVRVISRRNLIATALAGVFLGVCLIGFEFWLGSLIDREGQEEADASVRRTAAQSDARISEVVNALGKLAALGVNSCAPDDMQALRQAAFNTIPVQEISILASSGETLCTHLGLDLGTRTVLSAEPMVGADGYTFEIVELDSSQRMTRIRRKARLGQNEIAALMPSVLLIPQISSKGDLFSAYAHVTTAAGNTVDMQGEYPQGEAFQAKKASEKFGIVVEVAMPRAPVVAKHSDLKWFGMSAIGVFAVSLAASLAFLRRRPADNPVDDLRRALKAGEFVPYYQPVVDIRSGQLRGAEVLVRWRKPDGTIVPPGSFIPLAESSGLIRAMTRDLMRRVCAEAGPALGRRPALKVSFNLAGQLFADESIIKDVRKIFAGSPLQMSQVVLEVTERDPIENFTETRRTIAALQGLGVRIAIDDVGTGHSGLSYMLKLGVDIIKIDKMFVDAIGTDRNSTTIVETLVDLAHNMRMDVIAEGVENFEQVMHLRDLGIRSAQGYVFAPPLPGGSFLQLVEAIDPLPAEMPAAAAPAAA